MHALDPIPPSCVPIAFAATPRLRATIPLFETRVPAGFPSPAEGYLQRPIDLNELLVANPPSTFMFRVEGHSMIGAHNRHAKRNGGVYALDHQSEEGRALVEEWPVAELWGVAGRLEKRLARLGIYTAGHLARAKRSLLRQSFGVVVERMALELSGVSCLELEEVQADRKNICSSRSFGRPVESLDELREAVASHATRAGEKLRAQGLAASAVCVFLVTNRHRPEQPQYNPQAGRELLVPTPFTPELIGECLRVLEAIYKPGFRYKKAGVLCLDLVPDDEKQASLFVPVDPEREEKERRLMAAVDKLNLWGGRGTVRAATLGAGGRQG